MTSRSDITVTLRCNNSCRFCPRTTLEHVKVRDAQELEPRLMAIRKQSSRVTLSGGEVTLLPGIVDLVATCRTMGFSEIAIITNARKLASGDLVDRLVEAGLTEACVSVYDLSPEVHDWFTATRGSLEETLAGLDRLLALARSRPQLSVRVNTLLGVRNAQGIEMLVKRLGEAGVRGFLVADLVLGEHYSEPLDHARVRDIARRITAARPDTPVVWRGFPLCVLAGIPGIVAEPMNIDTTLVDDRNLDTYFDEFFKNFAHVPACAGCIEAGRCPGPQKLYTRQLGSGSISPVTTASLSDMKGFEPSSDPGRLAITPTTACQMRCTYCQVKLGSSHARPEILDAAVDLLMTSRRKRVELQFFGGEPLLRRAEVERTMERASRLALERGKEILFTITTNGLLLDGELIDFLSGFDTRVLFSMDGPLDLVERTRPMRGKGKKGAHALVEKNLRRLVSSPVKHFVNIVATPGTTDRILSSVEYLAGMGVARVQICYALGPGWTVPSQEAFCAALVACARFAADRTARGRPFTIQNLGSHAEPVVLSNDLLVDVDGTLYGDAALFAEKAFPDLRGPYRVGHVLELASFDGLRRSRERNLFDLRRTYPPGTPGRLIVEMHMDMGRRVQSTLDALGPRASARDRNPLLDTVLTRSVPEQVRIMRAHPSMLKLPLLLLHNPCSWNCIFCKSKPLEPTCFDDVARWLADNDQAREPRLGLVGNEPLLHPDIDRIIAAARQHHFERFDALTTGDPLADPSRARDLFSAGVTGYSLPLFGSSPEVHDAISGAAGSHGRSVAAIDNLVGLGASVHIHTNLVRQNIEDLARLERMVRERWNLPFCVIPVRPKDANLPYAEVAVSYPEIVACARVSSLVAFPLCVARKVQDPAILDGSIVSDVLKMYVLDQPFVKPPLCATCTLRSRCSGTFDALLGLYGPAGLEPVLPTKGTSV